MDRWRAAWALLALAACFASSAAAPTIGNHTALDLYDAPKEGCYYNFQHYGEGDRIMTNEPCLNCTCHNRMLMCYLRVCPFTKAIGQDCTVEKRADQCCPIVTCPDVPVDLLTSTTTSPAEYGGTGVGKVDNYGCSINGRYFPEGAKVPSTPNKPCEHCYCIRNMTTCVMQECTLHVDGCTPIYHKDVCCPVRYHCDHPEDEVLLLDDMSTTVRPTPGFILTTPAPTEPPVTESTRKDCVDNDQLYPDGALIKTEKPCVHCYCMKGDIVCVVQECGTPMENEGKNCTSLAPREGQCCPDTYICEGDELTSEFSTESPYVESTTLQPPRRVSVEGSGYRNEPDEIPYTEIPTFASEIEGSGEELMTVAPLDTSDLMKPEQEPTDETFVDRYATEGIPQDKITTQSPLSEEADLSTAEPDEEFNIMPSESEKEKTVAPLLESTTPRDVSKTTQENVINEQKTDSNIITKEESTEPSSSDNIPEEEITSKEPASATSLEEITTLKYEEKTTVVDAISEQTTIETILESSSEPSILKDTAPSDDIKTTKTPAETEHTISSEIFKEGTSEQSVTYETTLSELEATEPSIYHKTTTSELETKEPSVMHRTTFSELDITEPSVTQSTKLSELDTTEPSLMQSTKFRESETTEPSVLHRTTLGEFDTVEPSIMQSTKISELDTTEPSVMHTTKLIELETTESSAMHSTKTSELETTEPSDMHSTKLSELERTEPSVMHSTKLSELETTESSVMHRTTYSESETVDPSIMHRTTLSELETTEKSETSEKETVPYTIEGEELEATKTSPVSDEKTTESAISNKVSEVESTEPTTQEKTTATDISSSTESGISEHNAITSEAIEGESAEPSTLETMTPKEETKTESAIISEHTVPSTIMEEQSSEPSMLDKTTVKDEVKPTETSIASVEEQMPESGSMPTIKEDENVITTESGFRRTGEDKPMDEIFVDHEIEKATTAFDKESSVTSAYETPSAETIAPTDYESQFTTSQPVKEPETKETEQSQEPITESIVELSTFAHITEKESVTSPTVGIEVESTTYVEKVEAPETSSINPEDNEIGEDVSQISPPGRIPGEGDCLLNGITYKNDSLIASTNKCHSGCKCVSSIVKCDPIICSPPPEYMENCQLTYDTPDSCCPTYVCDHSKETIPPQPHSQMSGTESPLPSPAIECNGDQCDVSKVKQPPTTVFEPSDQPDVSECDSHGCDVPVLSPTHTQALDQPEECNDDKCTQSTSCSDGKCEQPQVLPNKDQPLIPTIESETKPCQNAEECTETKIPDIATPACQGESCITNDKLCEGEDCKIVPGVIPTVETQQICENQEDCKQTYVPEISTSPCEGDSCSPTLQELPCVGENCVAKPEHIPPQVEPQICEKEEDCQQTSTPSDTSCVGESCTKVDCNAGECNLPPKPSQEPEICTDEGDCKKTEQGPPSEDKITQECTDSECLQQKPISTTPQTTPVSLLITDLLIPESNVPTESPESLTTLSKETIISAPEIEESEISDKTGEQEVASTKTPEDYVTKLDESTSEVPEFISELPESTLTEHKSPEIYTEESELTSESPKPNDFDTKVQEESTTITEEKITETPEISESFTEISLDKESHPEIKPETQTEIPGVTELYESGTTKILEDQEIEISTIIPLLVEDQDSMRTELPEQDVLEQVTKAPEVSETETQDDFNKLPEVSGTDDIKDPESPITGVEQETSTVSQYTTQDVTGTKAQEFSVEVTELPATSPKSEIEFTEPSVYESEVSETENPQMFNVSVESATKPQDISTEPYVEEELTTKIYAPSITERVTETSESHSSIPSESTETLLFTNPHETITTELPDKIPDRSGTESDIETSTMVLLGIETKLPPVSEIIETDVQTESPELSITSSVKYEIVTETYVPEETRTELPAIPTSLVQDASTPVSETMIDLEKIQTESPLSQVTIFEPLDATTQQEDIKEQDETYTEGPESYSKKPEESVLEEEKPVETPDSYNTEPPKTGTEITEESTSKPEIQSETSEKLEPEMEKQTELPAAISTQPEKIFTESPVTIATEQESVSEKESATDLSVKVTAEESLTTEQQDRMTEAPVTSTIISVQPLVTEQQESSTEEPIIEEDEAPVTDHKEINTELPAVPETEYPYVPYEKPEGTKEEPEISDEEVMGSDKPLVTEEYETDTEVPEPPAKNPEPETTIPDRTTEPADLENKFPETSKIPEIVTHVPVVAVTETRLTDGLPESQEKVTEIPESNVSQDIQEPVSDVTESQAYTTKEPEKYATDGKETTETPVQEKQTNAPTEFGTEELEISTTAPEVQTTLSEKDITDQKVTATETPKLSETESPELPIVIQEIETPAPEIEKIEPEVITTEEPLELITKTPTLTPAVVEAQTELPGVQDSGMDSQSTFTEQPELLVTERSEISTEASVSLTTKISDEKGTVATEQQAPVESITEITEPSESSSKTSVEVSTEIIEESGHTTEPKLEYSETTPYSIELEEHTHKIDEDILTISSSEQPITTRLDEHVTEHDELITEISTEMLPTEEKSTETSAFITTEKYETPYVSADPFGPAVQQTTAQPVPESAFSVAPEIPSEQPQETSEPSDKETDLTSTPIKTFEEESQTTPSIESGKPSVPEKEPIESTEKESTPSTTKPLGSTEIFETTAPEEEFIPVTVKSTTAKIEEEVTTQSPTSFDKFTKPEEKPVSEALPSTSAPEVPKPGLSELQPTDEVPSPEDESQFPPSGGYGQEPDYVEEDQAFGPGTCRYGGKVYVSAQQIPRDDPCDFCFCFRSDIICLQQSCPPPIHGCHEEPIQGFCCPRYECPVSMATTLNVTTTTTTTTTTLPPHFLPHAYKGAAQRRGCQIKGHTYKVGEVVRASSGPCLHCTCGGDGQMKCDPKACTPEPMLRQMIAAAVSAKRRR